MLVDVVVVELVDVVEETVVVDVAVVLVVGCGVLEQLDAGMVSLATKTLRVCSLHIASLNTMQNTTCERKVFAKAPAPCSDAVLEVPGLTVVSEKSTSIRYLICVVGLQSLAYAKSADENSHIPDWLLRAREDRCRSYRRPGSRRSLDTAILPPWK